MIYITRQSLLGKRSNLKEIADATGSPAAFTAKIMRQLSLRKLVDSQKGPNGGFWLTDEMISTITMKDIVEAIDGDGIYTSCVLGLDHCGDDAPCPYHPVFKETKEKWISAHSSITLADLANQSQGTTRLK